MNHGCKLPGLGTYHFSPILLPTRKSGTIRHLENGISEFYRGICHFNCANVKSSMSVIF